MKAPDYDFERRKRWAQVMRERLAMPQEKVLINAYNNWCTRMKRVNGGANPGQMRVRVMKRGSQRLMVLRAGKWFVAGITWNNLLQKAAFGPWKLIETTTLSKRWRE